MKNITVSLDDETYRRARVRAAEMGRSVSSIVREHLSSYAAEPSAAQKRSERLREFFTRMDAEGVGLHSAEHLSRDELYDRMLSERSR